MSAINYNDPSQAAYKASKTVTTGGVDILDAAITDGRELRKSQITIFVTCDLASATNVKLRFLYSPDGGTTYMATPVINNSTGVAADTPVVIDTTSYNISGTVYGAVIDLPFSASTAFKIKGTATTASSTVNVWIFTRDN